MGARDFELPELKLLVDAVQSSKFITEKKSKELIAKLEKLCCKTDAAAGIIKHYRVDKMQHTEILETERKGEESFKNFDLAAFAKKTFGMYGDFEGERNGRYFTNFREDTFQEFMKGIPELTIEDYWITGDVRPGRGEEKWLNLILRKSDIH